MSVPRCPDPDTRHPIPAHPRVGFLKNFITRNNVVVGDYTYYDDPGGAAGFEDRNVLYHFDFVGDKLVIGKFCAIATGARFIMNGGSHAMDGFSTYPFPIFPGWSAPIPVFPPRRDTIIGNDVWIGWDVTVMPGVTVGDGAIIGARAVVTRDVPPYAVVAGNPARVVRQRFDPETVAALLDIGWWNWPAATIQANVAAISGADINALRRGCPGKP